jgi:hypothetical protein
MNKFIEILLGLIILLLPIYLWITGLWGLGDAAIVFLKGGVIWLLIFIGATLLSLGLADLKN